MQHLSLDQLSKLREGALSGDELLAADDHLAECQECRAQLAAEPAASLCWSELVAGMRASAAAADQHVPYALLQAYVEGNGAEIDRARVESHLRECDSCRAEEAELRQFAAGYQQRRKQATPYSRYLIFGPIAATLLVGALLIRTHSRNVPLAVSLHDSGTVIGIDRQGHLTGASAASPAERDLLLSALRDGHIAVTIPEGLRSSRSVLLGAEAEKSFHVLSPVGQSVLAETVEFHWEPVKDAVGYEVQVFDADYQPQATSPLLPGPTWTLDHPLQRGKLYVWQVTAFRKAVPLKAPQPPDPEARFLIVGKVEADAIEQALQTHAGHLELAALDAQAGLCRESENEIDALARENAGSSLVQQIRAGLASQCDAAAQH